MELENYINSNIVSVNSLLSEQFENTNKFSDQIITIKELLLQNKNDTEKQYENQLIIKNENNLNNFYEHYLQKISNINENIINEIGKKFIVYNFKK
jgi:hypothetical protein